MQGFMISLLTVSVVMSVIALLYMAATPLLSKRYSAKGRYYLWLVIVAGLIIPFRPQFSDALIIIDIPIEALAPAVQMEGILKTTIQAGGAMPPVSNTESSTHSLVVPFIDQLADMKPLTLTGLSEPGANATATPRRIPIWQTITTIWLAGAIGFLGYHILKHYRFVKITKRWSEPITNNHTLDILQKLRIEMGITKQIGIYQCASIYSPMLTGFIRPRILLPNTEFDTKELRFILMHELVHYKRNDLYYGILVLIANGIHWFNPVAHMIARSIYTLCEISCDAEVVKSSDTDTRLHYSKMIIGVAGYSSKIKTAFSTNFYGGKNGMKNRISSIMDTRKKRVGVAIFCTLLIITLGAGLIFATSNSSNNESDSAQAATPHPTTPAIYMTAHENMEPHGFSEHEVAVSGGITNPTTALESPAHTSTLAQPTTESDASIMEERVFSHVFDATAFSTVTADLFATPVHIRTHQQDYILAVFDVVPEFEVGIRPQIEFNDQTGTLHITQEPCDSANIGINVFGSGNRVVDIRTYASLSLAPYRDLIIYEWQVVDGVDFGIIQDVSFYDVGLVTVYVPEGLSIDSINFNTTRGAMRAFGADILSVNNVTASVTSGSVLLRDLYLHDIEATAQSGSILLMGVTFGGNGDISARSGSAFVNDSQVNGVILAQVQSGSVFVSNSQIHRAMYASANSGSVFVADSQIYGIIRAHANSGSVFINDSRFYTDIAMSATSGSIFWNNAHAMRTASAEVSSGSIFLSGGTFVDTLTTDARSGSIWWTGVNAERDAFATVTSGDVTLTGSRVRGHLTASTTSGNMFLTNIDTDMDAANISYGRNSIVRIQ